VRWDHEGEVAAALQAAHHAPVGPLQNPDHLALGPPAAGATPHPRDDAVIVDRRAETIRGDEDIGKLVALGNDEAEAPAVPLQPPDDEVHALRHAVTLSTGAHALPPGL